MIIKASPSHKLHLKFNGKITLFCLDERKWRESKVRQRQGNKFSCLDKGLGEAKGNLTYVDPVHVNFSVHQSKSMYHF